MPAWPDKEEALQKEFLNDPQGLPSYGGGPTDPPCVIFNGLLQVERRSRSLSKRSPLG